MIKGDITELKRVAEESQYTMQLGIGLTDLSSLEPWDRYLRPLRRWQSNNEDIEYLK